eukprot:9118666-Heterocapsa_arctica.AAC.1
MDIIPPLTASSPANVHQTLCNGMRDSARYFACPRHAPFLGWCIAALPHSAHAFGRHGLM